MKTAIACIARNEDNYINEFLDYHLALGFNKIFVYCNNWKYSGNKYDISKVEFIDYPIVPAQPKCYNDFIQKYWKEFDWMTNIDVDEFVFLRNYTNINEFLEKRQNDDAIYVRWRLFGDNNLTTIENGNYSVIDRFTKCSTVLDEHNFGKLFINLKRTGNQIFFTEPHWISSRNFSFNVANENGTERTSIRNNFGKFSRITKANIEIAHYRNKTYNESFERRFNIQSAIWGTISDQLQNGQKFRTDIESFNKDFAKFNKNQIQNFEIVQFKNKLLERNNMKTISEKYILKCNDPSDINEHLPTLMKYAKECDTVVEFGVRAVVSSWALANARPKKLYCVDIQKFPEVDEFLAICKNENQHAQFVLGDTLKISIPETDMLFIDTKHTYEQLRQELARHHAKVKKYILFHDVFTFGYKDEGKNSPGKGLIPAIEDFLIEHGNEWKWKEFFKNNNGLGIIERIN